MGLEFVELLVIDVEVFVDFDDVSNGLKGPLPACVLSILVTHHLGEEALLLISDSTHVGLEEFVTEEFVKEYLVVELIDELGDLLVATEFLEKTFLLLIH